MTTSDAANAAVPCNQSTPMRDSVEPTSEKLTGNTDTPATKMQTDNKADATEMTNPPSLVDLATQCVSTGSGMEKRRAWADSPMEPAAVHASGGPCYELDPTPQEAAAAAAAAAAATAAAASYKPTFSDSGGEDSAKENKEIQSDKGDNGRGAKKKGT